MPTLPLARGSYERGQGPDVPLVNWFFEQDPRNVETQVALLMRPVLALFATAGAGPIRAVFRKEGVLSGVYLVVSGTNLYKVTTAGTVTQLGSNGIIPGTGRCSIDGIAATAYIAYGTGVVSTDGSTVSAVTFPDGAGCIAVGVINGYVLFVRASSQRFYWLTPGSTTIDGLDYLSAENSPDDIEGMRILSDEVMFFGKSTLEAWDPTGDPDFPFLRVAGRLFGIGCTNRDTIARAGDAVLWVGEDKDAGGRMVFSVQDRPQRVSTNAIEEKLRKVTDASLLRAFSFGADGHTFWCLSTGVETLVYDLTTNVWTEFKSYGLNEWRAHLGAPRGDGRVVAGDSVNGKLWLIDPDGVNDAGDPIERTFSARVQRTGIPLPMANLIMDCTVGTAATGDPVIYESHSDDGGHTWSTPRSARLGQAGEYARLVAWRRYRPIRRTRDFKFTITDDVRLTIRGAEVNGALK